jgi:AraC-like DNA-binding protein
MNLQILHAGYYNAPHTNIEYVGANEWYIEFYLSGLRYLRTDDAQGRRFFDLDHQAAPYLALYPPGSKSHFAFDTKRQNYVVQFEMSCLEYDGTALWRNADGGCWQLPLLLPVPSSAQLELVEIFSELIAGFNSGVPSGMSNAQIQLFKIFHYWVENNLQQHLHPAAVALRDEINNDTAARHTIEQLSNKLNYSRDHLRELFITSFGDTPLEYRKKCRIRRIVEMLKNSDFSLKEIAELCGMKHVTHLHAFVKTNLHTTPRALRCNVKMTLVSNRENF